MGKLIDKQRVIFRTKKNIPTGTCFFYLFFLHKTTCPMLFFLYLCRHKEEQIGKLSNKKKAKSYPKRKTFQNSSHES